jgi:hypothetical protein
MINKTIKIKKAKNNSPKFNKKIFLLAKLPKIINNVIHFLNNLK